MFLHNRGAAHGGPPVNPSSQKGNANRRAIANRDYERMAAQGPPPDARCLFLRTHGLASR